MKTKNQKWRIKTVKKNENALFKTTTVDELKSQKVKQVVVQCHKMQQNDKKDIMKKDNKEEKKR